MRKLFFVVISIALLIGFIYSPVAAAAPVSYESGILVTNLDTVNSGSIILTFYSPDGSTIATVDDTIEAGKTNEYYPLPSDVPSGFNGSVVISSSVPIASTSNLAGKDANQNRTHWASYSAFSVGSSQAYLPLLMKNNYGYYTMYYVQNTGSADVDVSIVYSDGQTVSITGLKPGSSKKIDQANETHAANTTFSAILTATGGEIAVAVVEYGNQLFAYSGFGTGSNTPMMPLVNSNNYGYWSSLLVQNVGSSDTTVTISYVPTKAGTACTETQLIQAGKAVRFAENAFTYAKAGLDTTCVLGERFIGTGFVTNNTANQPLVVVVNQVNGSASENKGAAYSAFNPDTGGEKVILPIIHDRNYGYWTSWTIVNVGTSTLAASSITCTVTGKDKYNNPVSVDFQNPSDLAPNSGWLEDNINKIADGFLGGAICQGPSGSKLVSTVNQLGQGSSWSGIDSLLVYEGISQ